MSNSIVGNRKIYYNTLPQGPSIVLKDVPQVLYRVVEDEHARGFVAGKVWVSTVASYRDTPSQSRRDVTDGHQGTEVTPSSMAEHLGFRLGHTFGSGNVVEWISSPSLSLCMSRFPVRSLCGKFGRSPGEPGKCIELRDPASFLKKLDEAVRRHALAGGRPVLGSACMEVHYFEDFVFPETTRPNGPPRHSALCKPVMRVEKHGANYYSIEAEFRALWDTGWGSQRSAELRPFLAELGDLGGIVRILDDRDLWPDDDPRIEVVIIPATPAGPS